MALSHISVLVQACVRPHHLSRRTLFPYTTLFRSSWRIIEAALDIRAAFAPKACRMLIDVGAKARSEEHTSELQSLTNIVCRLLLEKKKSISRLTAPPREEHTERARSSTFVQYVED